MEFRNIHIPDHLTIPVTDGDRRLLEEICRRRNQSVDDLAAEMLHRYLAVETFRSLREKSIPSAESQGFKTDEDVFKAIS